MKTFGNFTLLVAALLLTLNVQESNAQDETRNQYTLIVDGYDWGPGANKVVLPMVESIEKVNANDFSVAVERSATGVEMHEGEASGSRKIVHAYVSDAHGKFTSAGKHATLVLDVNPTDPLSSPIKYVFNDGRGSNQWINYNLTVTNTSTQQIWNTESGRIMPQLDQFDLKGIYNQGDISLTYASFTPKVSNEKSPLIIWLHGGGEGGKDPSIPAIANKATNYASSEIQAYFGGAYVLIPQSPSFWMQAEDGNYTRGDKNDIYHKTLIGLIKKYVADNPNIDTDRIYVGGCSNGGYMSLKLILEHPDYFAAAYISALAYHEKYITDAQIESIKNIPIWFVHSKDDPVTKAEETVVPLYKRLISAGAENVHFSFYNHVTDLSGFYGGEDFHFNGHWSWIYSHANDADFDFDGKPVLIDRKPVTIMEWMAAQKN